MAKPSWISTDKSSGTGKATVKVTAANTSMKRLGSLTVRAASGLTKTVGVQQDAPEFMAPFTSSITFKSERDTSIGIRDYLNLFRADGSQISICGSSIDTLPPKGSKTLTDERVVLLNSSRDSFVKLRYNFGDSANVSGTLTIAGQDVEISGLATGEKEFSVTLGQYGYTIRGTITVR